jgi:hypothetical protein
MRLDNLGNLIIWYKFETYILYFREERIIYNTISFLSLILFSKRGMSHVYNIVPGKGNSISKKKMDLLIQLSMGHNSA